MIKMRCLLMLASTLCFMAAQAQPALVKKNGSTHFEIDGKPFVMFTGELHNSTSTSESYMQEIGVWKQMKEANFNTVIASCSWDVIEREAGKYDFTSVDHVIRDARANGLKVVMIWFASWKNGNSTYTPSYIKRNPSKYPLVKNEEGQTLNVLSTFGEASKSADKAAFAALMRHIREIDKDNTVIMMQVENEMGILGSKRDFSAAAEKAWKGQVPADLINYLTANKGKLFPELEKVWAAAGHKTKGTWEEVFGKSHSNTEDWKEYPYYTEELFQAYYYAKYVGEVTAAGKAEHNIPMYVNNWLKQPGMGAPGGFPSGSPLPEVIDVWRSAAPAVDFTAPDIYINEYEWVLSQFALSENPIFIPECRSDVAKALYAYGEYDALGFAPFGFDGPSGQGAGGMSAEEYANFQKCYGLLSGMGTMLTDNYGSDKMRGFYVTADNPNPSIEMGDYIITFSSTQRMRAFDYGQGAEQLAAENAALAARNQNNMQSGALIIQTGADEFYIVAINGMLSFAPKNPKAKGRVLLDTLEEGTFKDGKWIPGRNLNGDEGRPNISGVGARRIKLYQSTVDAPAGRWG